MNDKQKSEIRQAIMTALAFHAYSPQQTQIVLEQAALVAYQMGKADGIMLAKEVVDGK